ncbi:MAG: cytochrome c biogenesis protein CcsA [Candidatus Omnitrophica bacterium]|nr:cytochrome c biogenesis protein CcsA [Candidatus Omnitrophota bacterium]
MPVFDLIHRITIFFSYAAFFSAFLSGILYLVQDSALKNKLSGAVFGRLPNLSLLDMVNYRSIGTGFPLLTISILAGLYLAKSAHGIYWQGFNSRQILSLAVWIIYALILHVRLTERLRGRKVAILSIAAFILMVIALVGDCQGGQGYGTE